MNEDGTALNEWGDEEYGPATRRFHALWDELAGASREAELAGRVVDALESRSDDGFWAAHRAARTHVHQGGIVFLWVGAANFAAEHDQRLQGWHPEGNRGGWELVQLRQWAAVAGDAGERWDGEARAVVRAARETPREWEGLLVELCENLGLQGAVTAVRRLQSEGGTST